MELGLTVDRTRDEALFLQVARGIASRIAAGGLAPGTALPRTRALASALGVHRNTVVAAYDELEGEGWVVSRQGDATRVSSEIPAAVRVRPRRTREADSATSVPFGFAREPLVVAPPVPVRYAFYGGVPELRALDTAEIARAYRRALRDRSLLGYAGAKGDPRLRAAIADFLARERGLLIEAEDVLIVRGSQMALDVLARVLLRPADVVAVESPGYRPAWQAFEAHGATLAEIPVDARGLDVEALERLLARTRIRAVYLTPHHQYPTMVALAPERRIALLALARRHRFAIIEDDYDHEFHYEGSPLLPLAARDDHGSVVYVGTFAKVLAPALRIGFVVARRPLLEACEAVRARIDRMGDTVVERAVASLIEDGFVERHARKSRRMYAARRDVLAAELRAQLGDVLSFEVPRGGLSLWASVRADVDAESWSLRARTLEVAVMPGSAFVRKRPPNAMRIGYGVLDEAELRQGVTQLARACPSTSSRHTGAAGLRGPGNQR